MRMSFLSDFNQNLNITTYFRKKKTHTNGGSQFHADERTDKRNLKVACRSCFEDVPKGGISNSCRARP